MPDPLTVADLAELHSWFDKRLERLHGTGLMPDATVARLLATVEARDAENAALREIVAAVAGIPIKADDLEPGPHWEPNWHLLITTATITRARALLGEEQR